MKAAIMQAGEPAPRYTEVPEPLVQGEGQQLITVKAAAIKHLDRSIASGKHYSAAKAGGQARIIGGDGIGLLADGTRVYALAVGGMAAEKALIETRRMVKVPDGLDDHTAAALPNAIAGSAIALRSRAGMKPGETVLISGATGVTGRVAVQIARHYGAGRIIATGRNEQSLEELKALGADEVISLQQDDEAILGQLKALHTQTPIDIVVDYLWGRPAALIFEILKGHGGFTHRTRYVSIGAMAGDALPLSASLLRSADLQLCGSGIGSWSREDVAALFAEIIPEAFELAAAGKLKVETVNVRLQDIAHIWDTEVPGGKRLVVVI